MFLSKMIILVGARIRYWPPAAETPKACHSKNTPHAASYCDIGEIHNRDLAMYEDNEICRKERTIPMYGPVVQ